MEKEGVKEDEEKEEMSEEEGIGRRGRKRKHLSKYVKKKESKKKKKDNDEFDDPASETKHRWTEERYKKAKKSILKIMKAKVAYHGSPIFRADLRAEARKLIGDTGLLDHLLKHIAGKITPGGKERFRRRHNPAGPMEYWLESADLENIRMQAGVKDPYWIPPEGWELGDSPTQDPVCARELKKLKEYVDTLKSDIQGLRSDKNLGHRSKCMDVVPAVTPLALDDGKQSQRLLLMQVKLQHPAGGMEYWLDSADLENIRMQAGVQDPYGDPPEGWKLGDSPTQDPACAKELKKLRENVDILKSQLQVLLSGKELGHGNICLDVVPVIAPLALDDVEQGQSLLLMQLKATQEDLLEKKAEIEEKLSKLTKDLQDFEAAQDDLLKKKAKIEEKLSNVAKAVEDIEEDMVVFIVEAKGKNRTEAAAPVNEVTDLNETLLLDGDTTNVDLP